MTSMMILSSTVKTTEEAIALAVAVSHAGNLASRAEPHRLATAKDAHKRAKARRRAAKYLVTKEIQSLTADDVSVDFHNKPMTLSDVLGEIGAYWTDEDGVLTSDVIEEPNDYNHSVYRYREMLTIRWLDGSQLSRSRFERIKMMAGM